MLYVEACESGSMFEGLLTDDLDIYVTTAANSYESSWGTYCPGVQSIALPIDTLFGLLDGLNVWDGDVW